MRSRLVVVILAALGIVASRAFGEEPGRKVSFNGNQVSLNAALRALSRLSDVDYRLDPKIPEVRVTVAFQEVPVGDAFRRVVEKASEQVPGITLVRKENVFIVGVRPDAPPPKLLPLDQTLRERNVTLVIQNLPLRSALELLARRPEGEPGGPAFKYTVDAAVPDVPITIRSSANREETLLKLIVMVAGSQVRDASMERRGDTYFIGIIPGAPSLGPGPEEFQRLARERGPDSSRRRYSLGVNRVPLRTILDALFNSVPRGDRKVATYRLKPDVPETPVTLDAVEASPERLLQAVLKKIIASHRELSFQQSEEELVVGFQAL